MIFIKLTIVTSGLHVKGDQRTCHIGYHFSSVKGHTVGSRAQIWTVSTGLQSLTSPLTHLRAVRDYIISQYSSECLAWPDSEKYLLSRIINLDFIASWSKHQISTFPESGGGNWFPEGAVVSELLCGASSGQTRLICLIKRCGKETVRKHYIQLHLILQSWWDLTITWS